MISFIVIGKNEGWRLTNCFDSIYKVAEHDKLIDFEVIYVDSKSTDDSLHRAMNFNNIRIYSITGECNAAIARNIGAKEARGNILFFIDGDMEILPGFLPTVLNEKSELIYPFVSGAYEDYNYNSNWEFVDISNRFNINTSEEKYEIVTGGLFIISAQMWRNAGGMDTRLKRNQDLDFGLKMSYKKIPLLRKGQLLANHHTLPYTSKQRINSNILFVRYTAVLTRKNWRNIDYLKYMMRNQYTAILLLILLLLSFFTSFYLLGFYAPFISLRASKARKKLNLSFLKSIYYLGSRDVFFLCMFFFYYPQTPQTAYKSLK